MGNLRKKIEIDLENLDRVIAELPGSEILSKLSVLELAGVATFIHNFYNGMENILKWVILEKGLDFPQGSSWHKDLLNLVSDQGIISLSTKTNWGIPGFSSFFQPRLCLGFICRTNGTISETGPRSLSYL